VIEIQRICVELSIFDPKLTKVLFNKKKKHTQKLHVRSLKISLKCHKVPQKGYFFKGILRKHSKITWPFKEFRAFAIDVFCALRDPDTRFSASVFFIKQLPLGH
jgi:hypothetical protein